MPNPKRQSILRSYIASLPREKRILHEAKRNADDLHQPEWPAKMLPNASNPARSRDERERQLREHRYAAESRANAYGTPGSKKVAQEARENERRYREFLDRMAGSQTLQPGTGEEENYPEWARRGEVRDPVEEAAKRVARRAKR